jgi:hypothetical protein
MTSTMRTLLPAMLGLALASAPLAAGAVGDAKPGAQAPKATTPVGKAQRCLELKKRIAEQQAKPKDAKPVSETIKQDIVWYQKNCL